MKNFMMAGIVLLLGVAFATAHQSADSDEAGRVLALEKVWNRALEQKDTKALELLLATTMASVETDGSLQSKSEFLAGFKAPGYQLAQAVNERSTVQVYGDSAVVVGILRIKGTDKGKPFTHRERFVDTWVKTDGSWQCVATTSNLIVTKQASEE